MSLIKSMSTVGGLTLVSRVAGFARDLVTSHTLGAGPVADAFFVALKLPNFFRSITAEGAFSMAFVPLYTDKKIKETQAAASEFTNMALSFMVAILLPLSVVMIWFMPFVIAVTAPGFSDDPEKFVLAVEMSRLAFPYMVLVTIAAILGAVLNAHNRFGPYAFAPVLFNLCLIVSVVFTPLFDTQGHAMAAFMSISGALQALWVWMYLRKTGLHVRFMLPRLTPDMRQLFKNMGPGILVASVFQVNLFMNLLIASLLPLGAISHLFYADRLYQLPFGVIGIAVGTALLPMFSQSVAREDMVQTRDLYNRSIEYMLVLTLPCAAGLLWAADPLVRTIYMHGAFKPTDAVPVIYILMAYAMGLPAYVLSRVYNAVFYAHKDTWTPVKNALITSGVNIPLSFVLAIPFGAMGIALSTAVVGWVLFLLLHVQVARKGYDLPLDDRVKRAVPRILLSTGFLVLVLVMCRYVLDPYFQGPLVHRIIPLLALAALSLIVYVFSIYITRALPFNDLKRYFTRKGRAQNHDTNSNTIDPDSGA